MDSSFHWVTSRRRTPFRQIGDGGSLATEPPRELLVDWTRSMRRSALESILRAADEGRAVEKRKFTNGDRASPLDYSRGRICPITRASEGRALFGSARLSDFA